MRLGQACFLESSQHDQGVHEANGMRMKLVIKLLMSIWVYSKYSKL